jgi:hypothetical protein
MKQLSIGMNAALVALSVIMWTEVSSAVVVGTSPATSFLGQDEEGEEERSLVERWCDEHKLSPRFYGLFTEQDLIVNQLIARHRETTAAANEDFNTKRLSGMEEMAALRKELISGIEGLVENQRKKGDLREIIGPLKDLVDRIRGGGEIPEALNSHEKPTKRGRIRAVETDVFEGHDYARVNGQLGWLDAQRWCEERGGYLACVESRAELEFLGGWMIDQKTTDRLDAMQPHVLNYWVGASDSIKEGEWLWQSGRKVDMSLFHREGVPAQPSNFIWGEHHAGLTLFQAKGSDEIQSGLISWNMATGSRWICEWGRSRLPAPWDVLTEKEVEKLLVPYWKQAEELDEKHTKAQGKRRKSSAYKRSDKAFAKSIETRRRKLRVRLMGWRKDAVRRDDEVYADSIKGLLHYMEAGGLDCPTPEAPESLRGELVSLGTAFGKEYFFIKEKMTFHDAERYCREKGGHLPTPQCDLGLDLVKYLLESNTSGTMTWLGIAWYPSYRSSSRHGWTGIEVDTEGARTPWGEAMIEHATLPTPGNFYTSCFVLKSEGVLNRYGDETEGPRNPELQNSQIRFPFLCVVEGS